MRNRPLLLTAAFLIASILPPSIEAEPDERVRAISIPDSSLISESGAGASYLPVLSANARYVAFVSSANNLVTNDDDGLNLDVFVRDLENRKTILVSQNYAGMGGGNGNSVLGDISQDGRFIVFESDANNLVTNDFNNASDVFLFDLATRITTVVSVNRPGTTSAKGASHNPTMTPDGRFVVFESLANDLTLNDFNGVSDVFVRDLAAGVTTLASININRTSSGNGPSESPSINPDGRFLVFVSSATDLVNTPGESLGGIYLRDFLTGTTTWISSEIANITKDRLRPSDPFINATGRYVAFGASSVSTNIKAFAFCRDLQTGDTTLIQSAGLVKVAGISADGQRVLFESDGSIFVRDNQMATNSLVSVNHKGTGPANGQCQSPIVSENGRLVLFLSNSSDLVENTLGGAFQLYLRDLSAGTTKLISLNRVGLPSDDLSYTSPSITPDGRFAVFDSRDASMVAEDRNGESDIFLRDLLVDATELVSQRHERLPTMTGDNSTSMGGSFFDHVVNVLGDDSRFVAFKSKAANLVTNDFDKLDDAFVYDAFTERNALVSVKTNGVAEGVKSLAVGNRIQISANGRIVAFTSNRSGFVPNDANRLEDVFLRDMHTGITTLVSINKNGTASGQGSSWSPVMSDDGRYVAFMSSAIDLISSSSGSQQIYIRDMRLRETRLVSANRQSLARPSMSSDGHYVAFYGGFFPGSLYVWDASTGTNASIGITSYSEQHIFSANARHLAFLSRSDGITRVYVHNLAAHENLLISNVSTNYRYRAHPVISADGRFVAFASDFDLTGNDTNGIRDIFMRDVETGVTKLISVNLSGSKSGNGSSDYPAMSANGRFIAFESVATDLTRDKVDGKRNIYLRDMQAGTTELISRNRMGLGGGNNSSTRPFISRNGRLIVFSSRASDLVEGDYNNLPDLFYMRLSQRSFADTDGDGVDDSWEYVYFGNLSKTGAEDSDGDQQIDIEEFKAGTNPILGAQPLPLRIVKLIPITAINPTIVWDALPGETYRVQFRDDLAAGSWIDLEGLVVADGPTALKIDFTANGKPQRFYRVVSP